MEEESIPDGVHIGGVECIVEHKEKMKDAFYAIPGLLRTLRRYHKNSLAE